MPRTYLGGDRSLRGGCSDAVVNWEGVVSAPLGKTLSKNGHHVNAFGHLSVFIIFNMREKCKPRACFLEEETVISLRQRGSVITSIRIGVLVYLGRLYGLEILLTSGKKCQLMVLSFTKKRNAVAHLIYKTVVRMDVDHQGRRS